MRCCLNNKTSNEVNSVEFVNSYEPNSVTAKVSAAKTISGRSWADGDSGEYTFVLEPAAPSLNDADGKKGILPENKEKLTAKAVTNSAKDGGIATFEEITFTEVGNYYYTLSEGDVPDEIHGVDKDPKKVSVIIRVTDSGGDLEASVSYDGDDSVEFTNVFTSGKASIGGLKSISGRAWTSADSGIYEFTLKPIGSAPMPSGSKEENGEVSYTVKATTAAGGNGGRFVFPAISYENEGTYEYTITETGGSADGVSRDENVAKVKVVIDENLHPTVTYSYADGEYSSERPTFSNIYTPEAVKTNLKAQKDIDGRDWDDDIDVDRYEFTLTPESSGSPMPEGSENGVYTAKAGKGGKIEFPEISFDKIGSYVYIIAEKKYDANGVKSTSETHKATVNVADADNNGVLEITVKYDSDSDDAPTFVNEYSHGTAEAVVSVKKKLLKNGTEQSLNGYSFSFALSEGENPNGGMVLPESKTASVSDETAKAEFEKITFTKAGKYSVTVKENDNGGEVIYDQRTLTVWFDVVEDPEKGELSVTTVYEFDDKTDDSTFENELEPSAPHVTIEKTQQVNGDGEPTKEKLEVKANDEVTYFLTVISDGEDGSIAKNVTVTDKVPDGLTLISISDEGTESGGVITWQLGDMPKGDKKTVSFTVTVPEVVGGAEWTNIAYTDYDRPSRPEEPEIPSNEVEIEEKCGSLIIRKTVGGNAGDTVGAFEFLIVLTDGSGNPLSGRYPYSGSRSGEITSGEKISLSHGESVTIEGIPVGTHYEVTEIDSRGHTAKSSGDVGEISSEAASVANFVNIRNIEQPNIPNGSLTISKTVEDDGDASREFIFTLRLYDAFGRELTGSFGYVGSKSGRISSGGTVTLKHGESITMLGIPAGTQYVVTEEPAEGYISIPTGETGTITPGGEEIAAFINVPVIIVQRPTEAGHLGEDTIDSIAPTEASKRSPRGNLAIILLALATCSVWTVALMSMRKKRHRK